MLRQKGQLYFDDERTGLDISIINQMIDDKFFTDCYPIALKHFLALTDKIQNCGPRDLQWLKMEYTLPYFADLVFRCKNKVFAVLFAAVDESGFISSYSTDVDLFINNCVKNDHFPCLLPFDYTHQVINLTYDKWALIDATSFLSNNQINAIVPEELGNDEIAVSSDWELYNMATMAIVEDLCNKQNLDQVLYQTYEGVDPAICWIDKNNVFNWMVIRVQKDGDPIPEKPEMELQRIQRNNGLGHYGVCEISNPYAKGVYPRGQAFDLRFEIEDL